jgi:hypothetical protein
MLEYQELKEMEQNKLTYLLKHTYDIGERGVYIQSNFNPVDAAVYLQFKAEELFNDGVSLSNLAVANALVSLYGCFCGAKKETATVIDLYSEREARCGEWFTNKNGFLNPEIQREDSELICFLKPHIGDQ